jgi:hypothetical protein
MTEARSAMLPPLPWDHTTEASACGWVTCQACRRTPSAVRIQRSSTPGGGFPTIGSGKNTSRSIIAGRETRAAASSRPENMAAGRRISRIQPTRSATLPKCTLDCTMR